MSTRPEGVGEKVAARRARFRQAVERLSDKAKTTELLRMVLLPGAFFLLAGFVLMFLGWYGAARTPRQIEQVPYLISGGFIGLGLVFLGSLILACAFWMSMLQRFQEQAEERAERREQEIQERLRGEGPVATPRVARNGRRGIDARRGRPRG